MHKDITLIQKRLDIVANANKGYLRRDAEIISETHKRVELGAVARYHDTEMWQTGDRDRAKQDVEAFLWNQLRNG